jgi:hypothetical protein
MVERNPLGRNPRLVRNLGPEKSPPGRVKTDFDPFRVN